MSTLAFSLLECVLPMKWRYAHHKSLHIVAPAVSTRCTKAANIAMPFVASSAIPARARAAKSPKITPLRVVRVVEQGQSRGHVGRMVISGSMADVCAELDRLAACEAA